MPEKWCNKAGSMRDNVNRTSFKFYNDKPTEVVGHEANDLRPNCIRGAMKRSSILRNGLVRLECASAVLCYSPVKCLSDIGSSLVKVDRELVLTFLQGLRVHCTDLDDVVNTMLVRVCTMMMVGKQAKSMLGHNSMTSFEFGRGSSTPHITQIANLDVRCYPARRRIQLRSLYLATGQ